MKINNHTCSGLSKKIVILKIVPIRIWGPEGSEIVAALLDEGSTTTLIDKSVAESVDLDGSSIPFTLKGTGVSQKLWI